MQFRGDGRRIAAGTCGECLADRSADGDRCRGRHAPHCLRDRAAGMRFRLARDLLRHGRPVLRAAHRLPDRRGSDHADDRHPGLQGPGSPHQEPTAGRRCGSICPRSCARPQASAQQTTSIVMRETYLTFALWTSAIAIGMWAAGPALFLRGLLTPHLPSRCSAPSRSNGRSQARLQPGSIASWAATSGPASTLGGPRRRGEQAGGGAGNELVDVDIRRDGIVILVDQERGGAMHEGPQSQCNLLRVSAHLVALAVEGDLVDELGKAGVSRPRARARPS